MAIVNQTILDLMYVGWQTKLMDSFRGTKTFWQQLAMPISSSSGTENYPFIEDLGSMLEYFGEIPIESIVAQMHSVPNKKFGRVYSVRREDIERDQLKLLPTTAASFGSMMALWRDDMLSDVLGNLESIVGYDKQPFLDTDHVAPNGAIVSNLGTKKLDFSTLAKAQGSFGVGKGAMTALKNKDNKSLRVRPTVLVVGNDLEDMANTGMTAEKLDDGKVNIYRNSCKVMVVPDMPAEHWMLVDTSKPMKPFLMQVEVEPQPLPPPSVDSDRWKLEEKADFGCKARGNAHVGMWQLAWGSNGTVA